MPDVRLETHADDPQLRVITLDRPEARNAYSDAMVRELVEALDEVEADDGARGLILTGAGSAFSAGGDLKAMQAHSGMFEGDAVRLRDRYMRGIQRIPRRMARFDKPVVAAVNGPAIGAGLDLACTCDLRVAAEDARFGSTFVKVGLIPGDGGAWLLSRTIGYPRALEMVLTGRILDAQEALSIGLIHAAVTRVELMNHATRMLQRITRNAPLAVRLAKSAAQRAWELPFEAALEMAATYQGIVQNSADHDEGVAAILEKRRPEFKG